MIINYVIKLLASSLIINMLSVEFKNNFTICSPDCHFPHKEFCKYYCLIFDDIGLTLD